MISKEVIGFVLGTFYHGSFFEFLFIVKSFYGYSRS